MCGSLYEVGVTSFVGVNFILNSERNQLAVTKTYHERRVLVNVRNRRIVEGNITGLSHCLLILIVY